MNFTRNDWEKFLGVKGDERYSTKQLILSDNLYTCPMKWIIYITIIILTYICLCQVL